MGGIGSIVSAIIALAALIISIVFMHKANKVGKNDYRFKIFNRGKGNICKVRLIDLAVNSSALIASDIKRKFPMPILEQHQSVELAAAVIHSAGPSGHIKLKWDDQTCVDHEKELMPIL